MEGNIPWQEKSEFQLMRQQLQRNQWYELRVLLVGVPSLNAFLPVHSWSEAEMFWHWGAFLLLNFLGCLGGFWSQLPPPPNFLVWICECCFVHNAAVASLSLCVAELEVEQIWVLVWKPTWVGTLHWNVNVQMEGWHLCKYVIITCRGFGFSLHWLLATIAIESDSVACLKFIICLSNS